jgi:hypothetical protein
VERKIHLREVQEAVGGAGAGAGAGAGGPRPLAAAFPVFTKTPRNKKPTPNARSPPSTPQIWIWHRAPCPRSQFSVLSSQFQQREPEWNGAMEQPPGSPRERGPQRMVLKWPDSGTERVFCSPSGPLPTPGGPRAWGANPMAPHHPAYQRADVSCCQCPDAVLPPLSRELWFYPGSEKHCIRLPSGRGSSWFVETIRILLKQKDLSKSCPMQPKNAASVRCSRSHRPPMRT